MKELKKYQCDICHTEYANKTDATKCEKHHILPKTIKSVFAHPVTIEKTPYPRKIRVEMKDGKVVEYIRSHNVKES